MPGRATLCRLCHKGRKRNLGWVAHLQSMTTRPNTRRPQAFGRFRFTCRTSAAMTMINSPWA